MSIGNMSIDFKVDGVNYRYSHCEGQIHEERDNRWFFFCKLPASEVPSENYLISEVRYRNMQSE